MGCCLKELQGAPLYSESGTEDSASDNADEEDSNFCSERERHQANSMASTSQV